MTGNFIVFYFYSVSSLKQEGEAAYKLSGGKTEAWVRSVLAGQYLKCSYSNCTHTYPQIGNFGSFSYQYDAQ